MFEFEETDWKVPICVECESKIFDKNCIMLRHNKTEIPNLPFLAADMQIAKIKKWATLVSTERDKIYYMSRSKLEKMILGCDIKVGGHVPDQWWIFGKVGSEITLVWLGPYDNNR